MFARLLTFLAFLFIAPFAFAEAPVINGMVGDVSSVVACDTAEQVDSIIAAWQISPEAGHDTYGALAQPGTGIFGAEPACIIGNGIIKVSIVSVEPRGQIMVDGVAHETWRVGVERQLSSGGSISFFLLWSDATSIRYGPDA